MNFPKITTKLLGVCLIFTLVFLLLASLSLMKVESISNFSGTTLILVAGWTVITVIILNDYVFSSWCENAIQNAKWLWHERMASVVTHDFTPMAKVIDDPDDVALASRELIVNLIGSPIFLNARVVFLGAAANQSDKSKRDALALSEDAERTPTQVYQGAVEEIMSSNVPVFRIMRLLTPDEYQSRSYAKQSQYISWLSNQISQLKRNKNYVFFDNQRAPMWGSSGASIFTEIGFLQFTSAGGDALFIKDEWISRNLLKSTMKNLKNANKENKVAYTNMETSEFLISPESETYGTKVPVDELTDHMEELGKLNTPSKS